MWTTRVFQPPPDDDCGTDRRGLCPPARGPHAACFLGEHCCRASGPTPDRVMAAMGCGIPRRSHGLVPNWSLAEVGAQVACRSHPLTAALNVAYMSRSLRFSSSRRRAGARIHGPNTVRSGPDCGHRTRTQRSPGPRSWGFHCRPTGVTRCYEFPSSLTDAVIPSLARARGLSRILPPLQFASPRGRHVEQTDRARRCGPGGCWSIQVPRFSVWPPRVIVIRARRCCRPEATRWRISRPSLDPALPCFIACRCAR